MLEPQHQHDRTARECARFRRRRVPASEGRASTRRTTGLEAERGGHRCSGSAGRQRARRKATRSFFSWSVSFSPEHEVEELDRVLQRQQAVVVQVRRRVLDAAQREGLDRAVGRGLAAVDHLLLEEALDPQVVHEVVGVVRRGVAGDALGLAEEQLLAAQLALAGLGGIELAEHVELGRRREVEQVLELGHEVHLAAALEDVDALALRLHRVAVEVGGALLELGEVLDGLHRALRAEETLDVHAAQRRRVDAVPVLVRAGCRRPCAWRRWCGRWRGSRSRRRPGGRSRAAAVLGGVELRLRKRRDQQPQAFELLRDSGCP